MKNWLMPFGFLAGLSFSNMTNLTTFSFLNLNTFGESLVGGLLGLGSGYIGSFFAAGSINLRGFLLLHFLLRHHLVLSK